MHWLHHRCYTDENEAEGNLGQNRVGYRLWGSQSFRVCYWKMVDNLLHSCNVLFCDCFELKWVSVPCKEE